MKIINFDFWKFYDFGSFNIKQDKMRSNVYFIQIRVYQEILENGESCVQCKRIKDIDYNVLSLNFSIDSYYCFCDFELVKVFLRKFQKEYVIQGMKIKLNFIESSVMMVRTQRVVIDNIIIMVIIVIDII